MKPSEMFWFSCVALLTSLPMQVNAQTSPALPVTADTTQQSARPVGFDKPVAAAALESYRGGTEIVRNDMELAGTTAGNTAVNVATGSNIISAGAFSSMSGLPVVIQNTGANVLIQNAVILHLQMN